MKTKNPAHFASYVILISGIIVTIITVIVYNTDFDDTPPPFKSFTPTDPALITSHNHAVALMGRFEYAKAVDAFQKLVDQHPNWITAKTNLAIATLNRQKPPKEDTAKALELFAEILKVQPDNLRAQYCSGVLLFFQGKFNDALPRFLAVVEADPSDAFAAYYAAQCYIDQEKPQLALSWLKKAAQRDPYLRSAHYTLSQLYLQMGDEQSSEKARAEFNKLDSNPQAKTAEIKYTRMGPKAEVELVSLKKPEPLPERSDEPPFKPSTPLPLTEPSRYPWRNFGIKDIQPNITIADINGDSMLDIFIANALDGDAPNAVLIQTTDGRFTIQHEHTIARVPDVTIALWGDFDNDTLTDVYLCRKGSNRLYKQTQAGHYLDVTKSTGTSGGKMHTVDAAWVDADHDGDLDIFLVNRDGPNELLNNNLDGTYTAIAQKQGIAGTSSPSKAVIVTDLDQDDDMDLIVINETGSHKVYINDRLWKYKTLTSPEFTSSAITSAFAWDANADGRVEIYTGHDQRITRWILAKDQLVKTPDQPSDKLPGSHLVAMDTTGTGVRQFRSLPSASSALANLSPSNGYSIISLASGNPPSIKMPNGSRHQFISLSFSGKHKKADQMRSNASGIGVKFAARIDSRWIVGDTYKASTLRGQSLQPVPVGIGMKNKIDFLKVTWPDAVLQTEIYLAANQHHRIEEIQRQMASCPVLFAWNGSEYQFVTDILGVGGIGFALGPNQYATPRPNESLLLPLHLLQPRDNAYQLKIGEPMQEACYLDNTQLIYYDLPPSWHMTLDERMATSDPVPTRNPIFYQHIMHLVHAKTNHHSDVTRQLSKPDHHFAPIPPKDRRFLGRTKRNIITLTFPKPINARKNPILIFNGWVEYPYSQTMFAAHQAKASYDPPTLQAQDQEGVWHTILPQFGYPAGFPRESAVPIPSDKLPPKTKRLRLITNLEIYYDRIAIAWADSLPNIKPNALKLQSAILQEVGFAHRTTSATHMPNYNYNKRVPLWDTRHQTGYYTRFGNVTELVNRKDSALATFGPGEEVHLNFALPTSPPPTNHKRRFILRTSGWCKDMDLYTKTGETLAPLPAHHPLTPAEEKHRRSLHQKYHTRYRSGP